MTGLIIGRWYRVSGFGPDGREVAEGCYRGEENGRPSFWPVVWISITDPANIGKVVCAGPRAKIVAIKGHTLGRENKPCASS